jgi:hypothetical protein
MNLNDLSELMDERYESDAVPVLTENRVDGIRRKVTAARQRRAAGTLAAAVLVVVGVVAGALTIPTAIGNHPTPASTDPVDGFPIWANGGELIGAGQVPLSDGATISLTVTPEQLDLSYEMRCTTDALAAVVEVDWTVDGNDLPGGLCAGSVIPNADIWAQYGLEAGTPATFTATVTGAFANVIDPDPALPMPNGVLSIAVRQRVPFDQYQFPDRPDPLPTLDPEVVGAGSPDVHLVSSDADDPTAPQSITVTWPQVVDPDTEWLSYEANSQTPGYLHLFINGVPLGTAEFWTYYDSNSNTYRGTLSATGVADLGLDFHPGDTLTFTVVPEHVTGAWVVGLNEPDA